jgi:hypothetical protein
LDLLIETIGTAEEFENDRATRLSHVLEFIIACDPAAVAPGYQCCAISGLCFAGEMLWLVAVDNRSPSAAR